MQTVAQVAGMLSALLNLATIGDLATLAQSPPPVMHSLKLRLAVIYLFLGMVAAFSIHNTWLLQTNPFVSYLGAGRWFYLALDVGAIVASGLTARMLMLRARVGPRFVALIGWAVLLTYLGGNLLIYFELTSTPLLSALGVKVACISLLAVAALIILRTRVFVDGYGHGPDLR